LFFCVLICSFYFTSFHFVLFCLSFYIIFISLLVVKGNLQYVLVFSSYGRGCNNEVIQAVVRFVTPAPLRNPHPAGTAKGCRDAVKDFLLVTLAGHNKHIQIYITQNNKPGGRESF
jgi:hypothetical protein